MAKNMGLTIHYSLTTIHHMQDIANSVKNMERGA
jgi:hypothetical protein